MTKSGALRRYNSGINNVHDRLTGNSADSKASRRKYYELTGNNIYLEKNFQKSKKAGGKTGISIKQVKSDFASIRELKTGILKNEYRRLKEENNFEIEELRKKLAKEKKRKYKNGKFKNRERVKDLQEKIKKKRKSLANQDEFIGNNLHDDLEYQDIRELFNSA